MLAQDLKPTEAARLWRVWLHSRAARIAGGRDDRGVPMEQVADARQTPQSTCGTAGPLTQTLAQAPTAALGVSPGAP